MININKQVEKNFSKKWVDNIIKGWDYPDKETYVLRKNYRFEK